MDAVHELLRYLVIGESKLNCKHSKAGKKKNQEVQVYYLRETIHRT